MATYTANYNLNKPTNAERADIATINNNMDSIDDIMHSTQVSIAPAYSASESYSAGDRVMYELLLYEANDDTTGTWDATKWDRVYAAGSGGSSRVNYSTTEQVIGTWIDGSPIYQKTYVFNQSIAIQNNSYADITQEVPDYVDMDTIITAFVTSNAKAADSVWCGMDNNAFCLYCAEGINADTLTIQYTKVTV